ncbi:GtrA family protein [Halobacterium litoreum]|uniref:GtrA family protein n=1 Tax=Halobacterium litoreum TaxID=2039234 RepID=A0ABD5NGD6_9EURY|nr:GtrA family protein [Halobacterium litoreum]UHH12863.1 GtrA family protein [Halobacterium litoreum]
MTGVITTAERRVEAALRSLGVGRLARPARVVRAVEFGAVGATGTLVNAAVFVLAPVAYLFAGVLAFATGTTWTFAFNWTITYNRPRSSLLSAFWRYASVYVAGFLVYGAALAAAVEVGGFPTLHANLLAIVVAGTLNFAGSELYALAED